MRAFFIQETQTIDGLRYNLTSKEYPAGQLRQETIRSLNVTDLREIANVCTLYANSAEQYQKIDPTKRQTLPAIKD